MNRVYIDTTLHTYQSPMGWREHAGACTDQNCWTIHVQACEPCGTGTPCAWAIKQFSPQKIKI